MRTSGGGGILQICQILAIWGAVAFVGREAQGWDGWVGPRCEGGAEYRTFSSPESGGEVSYHILLPPSYGGRSDARYPVIYWLHGTGGGCEGVNAVASHYRALMGAGEIPESIVVFPNGLGRGMWCDSKDGVTKPESMLILDLIPHIDQTYRTKTERRDRALEGFSMGGYGAGRIGFRHGGLFGCITMYGAGPLHEDFLADDPRLQPLAARERLMRKVYGSDGGYYIQNLPQTQALKILESSHLRGAPEIRILVGDDDPLRDNNRKLSNLLRLELGIDHEYSEVEGVGHQAAALMEAARVSTGDFYRRNFGRVETE